MFSGTQKKVLFVEMENTLVATCASQKKNDFKINFFDENRGCFVVNYSFFSLERNELIVFLGKSL